MPKIAYRPKTFSADKQSMIDQAIEILEDFGARGYELTLRQLYYQFVSKALIANNEREYKNLGTLISDARLAGLIDWDSIIDRTRKVRTVPHWNEPSEIIAGAAAQFRIDKWADQRYRLEVWIEKDALVGVIENICTELDVPYFSCRGYTSQSEMWAGAMRLKSHVRNDQKALVLHFGDHDPSGIDMSRDIADRLQEFSQGAVEIRRLALNMPQIRQYNPPPNPAKVTDSRAVGYIRIHGTESWELDALDPDVITALIRNEIHAVRDADLWEAQVEVEDEHRAHLQKVSDQWQEISENL